MQYLFRHLRIACETVWKLASVKKTVSTRYGLHSLNTSNSTNIIWKKYRSSVSDDSSARTPTFLFFKRPLIFSNNSPDKTDNWFRTNEVEGRSELTVKYLVKSSRIDGCSSLCTGISAEANACIKSRAICNFWSCEVMKLRCDWQYFSPI